MSNVVNFEPKESAMYRCEDGVITVVNDSNDAEVVCNAVDGWMIVNGRPIEFKSRRHMAEFLWMAAHLVDSEGRWKRDEYVGVDYV
jgi:hypothetical protein